MRREFDWAQSTILPAMIDRVADAQKIVENAQAQNPGDLDLARMCWALGTYSASGTDRLEWIRLATEKNNLCITLAFPVKRIGSDWHVLLQMEAAPQGISVNKVAQRYAWRLSEHQRISLA